MTRSARFICALLVLGLSACQHYPIPPIDRPPAGAGLVGYAEELASLDAAGRQTALEAARAEWEDEDSTPADHARLGLARAQWGHKGYDPGAAVKDLQAALAANGADWSAHDREFLAFRIEQIQYTIARYSQHRSASQENEKLRHQLEEARRKLRAISEIEQQLGGD